MVSDEERWAMDSTREMVRKQTRRNAIMRRFIEEEIIGVMHPDSNLYQRALGVLREAYQEPDEEGGEQ